MDELLDVFPTIGSVRDRLSRMAAEIEPGELNTLLNDAEVELFKYRRKYTNLKWAADTFREALMRVCLEQAHDIPEDEKFEWARNRMLHYMNMGKTNE